MRATIQRFGKKKPFGITLLAETSEEQKILRRLFKGGAKTNSITIDNTKLDITFADLIKEDAKK